MIDYFFFAVGYYYFQTSIQKHKALQQSLRLQLEQEREKVRLENAALRAQINPHFLYNTLDFLYAQALPLNERLSDGIIRLSEMMRYSIRSQDGHGMVCLSEEIGHLENVIAIHRLRFGHTLYIRLDLPEQDITAIRIIPLVLITLVENVLKHGRLHDPGQPAIIRIHINNDVLEMTTQNQQRPGPKELSTGIGLANTRRRLSVAYGAHFTLHTHEDDHCFYTTLQLPLTYPIHYPIYDHQLYHPG